MHPNLAPGPNNCDVHEGGKLLLSIHPGQSNVAYQQQRIIDALRIYEMAKGIPETALQKLAEIWSEDDDGTGGII